ncbi:hypothetical protein C0584_05875 [Candidatus Parcubacteria bacterium]|nr:MAG: hypothetical protein C0584_05875 [Candidatus Parcubacteria bacterium]
MKVDKLIKDLYSLVCCKIEAGGDFLPAGRQGGGESQHPKINNVIRTWSPAFFEIWRHVGLTRPPNLKWRLGLSTKHNKKLLE